MLLPSESAWGVSILRMTLKKYCETLDKQHYFLRTAVFKNNNNYFFFFAALALHCCLQTFSSCNEQGYSSVEVGVLLIAVASLFCRAWALGAQASVAVVHRFWSTGSVGEH